MNVLKVLGLMLKYFLYLFFFVGSLSLMVVGIFVFWVTHANQPFHAIEWVWLGVVVMTYVLGLTSVFVDVVLLNR